MDRIVVFIDGPNLSRGLEDRGCKKYLWLDIQLFAANLVRRKTGQRLVRVEFFTSSSNGGQQERKDYNTYLDALDANGHRPTLGQFIHVDCRCPECPECKSDGDCRHVRSEKMTDVNIATRILEGAWRNDFDKAFLVSGDLDFHQLVLSAKHWPQPKQVIYFLPPCREPRAVTNAKPEKRVPFIRLEGMGTLFARSQLPEEVRGKFGYVLKHPSAWRS